jgi:hypothetical protein
MSIFMKSLRLATMLVCGLSLQPALQAAETPGDENPDWPCEQILVPEIAPAVVWAGPSIEGMQDAWRKDAEVESLVQRLTSADYNLDNADNDIGAFAKRQPAAEKDHKLTLLFAGVIQRLNEVRSNELNDIMRYARGQSDRANQLSGELDEMVKLQDDPSEAAQKRLALIQGEMELKQRMFDDREAFIQHLCGRPVVIEQKVGTLARTIAYYLD